MRFQNEFDSIICCLTHGFEKPQFSRNNECTRHFKALGDLRYRWGDFRFQKCLGKQNLKVFSKFRHNLCYRQDKFSSFQMKTFTGTLTYIVLKSSIWKDQYTIWTVRFENGMLFANFFLANGLATAVQIWCE